MTWFKVDDKISFHAKVLKAKNAAFGAWVRIGAWCAERETDGVIPFEAAVLMASPEELATLVKVELLHELEEGFQVHDYLAYNPSKAQLLAQRAEWAERRGHNRRRVSHVVSHSDTPLDTRERLTERLTKTPGTGTGEGSDPDPESDPDRDSHRASAPRLKHVQAPPAPQGGVGPESGYDLAKRVFSELWSAKYKREFKFDPFDAGPKSEKKVLQAFGGEARERGGPRAEEFARHWVKAYLRDHGDRGWLDANEHPARTLTRDMHKFADPPTGQQRAAQPARASPPEPPPVSMSEQAARASQAMKAIGKIGMGGTR